MTEEAKALKCKSCGAPVQYVAGESVLTCSYCGSSYIFNDDPSSIVKIKEHFAVPNRMRTDGLKASLKLYLTARYLGPRDFGERLSIGAVTGRYLPYWVIHANSDTRWTGQNVKHTTEGEGDEIRHKKVYIPADGSFKKEHWWPLYGRLTEEYEGQSGLKPGGMRVLPDWGDYPFAIFGFQRAVDRNHTEGREPFNIEDVSDGMTLLNGQVDQAKAELEARQEIELYCWDEAKSHVSILQQCETAVKVREAAYVHIPFWWLDYSYRGRTYNALFHGGTGELLYIQYPVGHVPKVCITSFIALALSALIWTTVTSPDWRMALLAVIWICVACHVIAALVDYYREGPYATPHPDE